jgi:ADP-ribose pyrophosphatase YjhB (NUDIX family)
MLHSCGAILYTIIRNKVYIILGKEFGDWFPFKGVCNKHETYEQAAIREIKEETCKTAIIKNIKLDCNYSTIRKYYHIGLVYVENNFVEKFNKNKKKIYSKFSKNKKYLEKTEVRMFSLNEVLSKRFHNITLFPIHFYFKFLIRTEVQTILINNRLQYLLYCIEQENNKNKSFQGEIVKSAICL